MDWPDFFATSLSKSGTSTRAADENNPAPRLGAEADIDVDNKYIYFVSYAHTGVSDRQHAFGNAEVVRDAPVMSMGDVEDMSDIIADIDEPIRDVVVLNWQVLRSPQAL